MNRQMEAELVLSTVKEGDQLNLSSTEQNLHVYGQELFCITVTVFTIYRVVKWLPESDNLVECPLDKA